jgi:hypothetical protein
VHFNANARVIAKGMEALVKTILQFPYGDDFPLPKIMIISPIHTGEEVEQSPFASFDRSSYEKSLALAPLFKKVAQDYGCSFFDASTVAQPSMIDQLHMDAPSHGSLAKALVPELQQLFDDQRQIFFEDERPEVEEQQSSDIPEWEVEKEPSAGEEYFATLQEELVESKVKKGHKGLSFKIPGFSKRKD